MIDCCVGDGDRPVVIIGYCYGVEVKIIEVVSLFVENKEGPGDGRYKLSGSRSSSRTGRFLPLEC